MAKKIKKAQDGKKVDYSYLANPMNWGVENYSREKSFNTAFEKAKKDGEEEFIWDGKKYNTKSNLPPKQQLERYGITDSQRLSTEGLSGNVRKRLSNNLFPATYDNPVDRLYTTLVKNEKDSDRKELDSLISKRSGKLAGGSWKTNDMLKERVDLNNLYFGQPQVHNTLTISDHSPSVGKDKNKEYYTSKTIKNLLKEISKKEGWTNHLDSISNKSMIVEPGWGNPDGNTANFKLSRGKDDKGDYISYYDKWDVAPFFRDEVYDNAGETDQSLGVGKPFEIYDRTYLPKEQKPKMKKGGVIKDNRGQWAHPGKVTQIDSNQITMKGVNYPVLGVSDTGDTKMMYPNQEYNFKGKTVTEFPMKAKKGKKVKKGQEGMSVASNMYNANLSLEDVSTEENPFISTPSFSTQQDHDVYHKQQVVKRMQTTHPELYQEYLKRAALGAGADTDAMIMAAGGIPTFTPPAKNQFTANSRSRILDMDFKVKKPQGYRYKQGLPAKGSINKGFQYGGSLSTNQTLEMLKPFAQDGLEEIQLKNALLAERQQKRDSVRSVLNKQFPNKYTNVSKGMTDYYKTEPPEYLQLDVNLLNQPRREALMKQYTSKKNFKNGGTKKAQYGYSEPSMEEYYPTGTGMSDPNGSGQTPIDMQQPQQQSLYNKIGGTAGVVQRINAVGYGMNAPGEASTAQKAVGQFGPWGQAISQVSQMGTNYFNNASNTYANNYASSIFDPAATFENKDLSSTDRLLGGLSPTYGAYVKRKARKQKQEKEDRLNVVVKQASEIEPDQGKRRYVRPEDQLVDPNQMFPTYGVGTNYLKHGGEVPYMERGGELKTYWGGEAESLSENPYLPSGGETVMFRGKSHSEGGIGMKFGGSPVEVEGGEPAVKLNDGGNKEALTVFGDMKIPSYGVSELNDPKAKGKKFKNYINDLSKIENKQNRLVEKGVNLVNNTSATDSFDKLKISSGKAMIEGGNMRLKQIADKKQIAANVQNAILETAEEFGLKSDELAKGKFKKAKMGKKIEYAQDGGQYTIPRYQMDEYQAYGYLPDPNDPNRMYRDLTTSGSTQTIPVTPPNRGSEEFNSAFAQARRAKLPEFDFNGKKYTTDMFQGRTKTITNPGTTARDYIYLQDDYPMLDPNSIPDNTSVGTETSGIEAVQQKERMDWLPIVNSIIPFIRPSNQMKLDRNQLLGEMNAMANNQLEPVQAQLYQPLLENVSDISLQDQLNANQADFNSIQRLTAQNPAAQSTLAAQKYQANSSVLGEQFRQNQNQKMGVFNRNRGVLNDATLKNLAILDQQYVRQSQAKSNTKAVAQQAINSISDKIARNKLENRTLGVYENLYNYRYDSSGRAWNMNPLAQFVIDQGAVKVDSNGKIAMDETKVKRDRFGNIINSTETSRVTDAPKKKNGGIVKAIKSL